MSDLRSEIIEAEKIRADLIKWKLLIVSGLGAAGLGFTQRATGTGVYLVLVLIPPVCFYVDLLCWHLSLRIKVIASFFREVTAPSTSVDTLYEEFLLSRLGKTSETSYFQFEDWALEWSTLVLSAMAFLAGVLLWHWPPQSAGTASSSSGEPNCINVLIQYAYLWFMISGVLGVLATLGIWLCYRRKVYAIERGS